MDRRSFISYTATAALLTATACSRLSTQAGATPAKPNPYLSGPIYGIVHFDSAQSDTVPYPVRRGTFRIDPSKMPRVSGGPVNIMNLVSTQPGFMWAVSTERVAYVDMTNGGWRMVAEIGLPGGKRGNESLLQRLVRSKHANLADLEKTVVELMGPSPEQALTNGLYSLCDRDNVVYANVGPVIHAVGLVDPSDPSRGLKIIRSINMANIFKPMSILGSPPIVRVVGMGMTYDGHLVVGSTNGIAILDRSFTKPAHIHTIEDGHLITNSFSIDESGGVYLASGSLTPRGDGILRKLIWTGSRITADEAQGAWSSPYDGGDWPPAIKAGTGTGSTPTLMGFGDKDEDRLVVLTDGSNRMNIVAFWRDGIPADFKQKPGTKSRRIADQMAIKAGLAPDTPWVQSEQSVVINGYGAFVVNNVVTGGHKDKLVDVLAVGPLIDPPKGMERVQWNRDERRWNSAWERGDVASTSMVPVASSTSGIVFVNGYSKKDGWEVTGMDWETGEICHRTIMGHDNLGNGAYALVQFTPEGDLIFNSVAGPLRINLTKL